MNDTPLYLEIIGQGYLQPRAHINAMNDYYKERGKVVETPLSAIRNWMRIEKGVPSINSQEIDYLSTFLRAMDPRGVCRFCDLLVDFELTPTQAIFTVKLPEAGIHAMDDWLAEHMDVRQLKAYRRAIMYRMTPTGSPSKGEG